MFLNLLKHTLCRSFPMQTQHKSFCLRLSINLVSALESGRLGGLEALAAQARADVFDRAQYLSKDGHDRLAKDIDGLHEAMNDILRNHDLLPW